MVSSAAAVEDAQADPPKRPRRRAAEPPAAEAAVETNGRRPMSAGHKAALAEGRDQGRAIRYYLEALEQHAPRRGRKRTTASVEKRLAVIEETIGHADPLTKLHLTQERLDLEAELARGVGGGVDMQELEDAFVDAVGPYSSRKGISYNAWRAMNVDPKVLRRAGMARG